MGKAVEDVRVEPGADVIEALAKIVWAIQDMPYGAPPWELAPHDAREATRAGIRAILDYLAAKGARVLPDDIRAKIAESRDFICRTWTQRQHALDLCDFIEGVVPVLAAERDTYAEGARKGATLAAMLSTYGLPDEPKALAAAIERERNAAKKAEDKIAAVLALTESDIALTVMRGGADCLRDVLALVHSRARGGTT